MRPEQLQFFPELGDCGFECSDAFLVGRNASR
jgi:hypothetical protein